MQPMTHLPEPQRRAIVRTAVTLGVIAFALFVYTLWRGMK
jgi:hypothetical protein